MSNSTRQGGYDERLVVPLEASRRGAHRARTNPLVAALPLLAVVVVVAAVIGVAYALFLKPGGDATATDPLASPSSPGPTGAPSQSSSQPATTTSPSTSASSSGASSTASSAPVNKNTAITVYNGTGITGLAKRASNALSAAGYKKAEFTTNKWGVPVSTTTVFYSKDSEAATAAAVAKALGVGKASRTTRDTGGGIAVVTAPDADAVLAG
jgi:hypothetical protein